MRQSYPDGFCRRRSAATVVRGRLLATNAVHYDNIDRGRLPRSGNAIDYRRLFMPPLSGAVTVTKIEKCKCIIIVADGTEKTIYDYVVKR